jgi:hypothetical protein
VIAFRTMSTPTPTASEPCHTDYLVQRMKVIERLLALNAEARDTSEREELERMHYQQSLWIQELQMIGEQLQTIVRNHELQASIDKIERGMTILGIRRQ